MIKCIPQEFEVIQYYDYDMAKSHSPRKDERSQNTPRGFLSVVPDHQFLLIQYCSIA